MNLSIIETNENEIRSINDIILVNVKEIKILKNKTKREIIEFMYDENKLTKSFNIISKLEEDIKSSIFDNLTIEELKSKLEEEEILLFSIIMSLVRHYKKSYQALNNTIKEVYIECNKESFLDTVYLAKNYNVKTTIKCQDMSLKEYSEILKDIDLKNLNIIVDYQEENTPIKIEELYKLSLLVSQVADSISKYNLSDLEKIMYVYDIVKYRIYNKDKTNYSNNRDLDKVINSNTIVCSGYSNLFNAILNSLNIKTMPIISYEAMHQRSIVYINDSKYNIDGVYAFDPTWDCRKNEEEKFYISKYTYFMMPLQRAKKTAYDNISQLLEEDIDKVIKSLYDAKSSKEEFIKSIEILKSLENLCNFININTNDEFNDKEYIILKSHPKLIEKYNSKEISNLDFFKLLYQVRRIEYNNLMIEDIDINDLIDTVEIRTININKTKSKNEITLKDLLLLLSIRDKIIKEIEEAIPSIEKEITPNSIGIERDITNIKLIKTLKKIQESKEKVK